MFAPARYTPVSVSAENVMPVTTNDIDLGSSSIQFKDAYIDGTLETDALTIGGTNVVTGSLITTLGTVSAGTWQGTAIGATYIAADAITGAKIADNAIDSEHYTDASIDAVHLAADAVTAAKIGDDVIDSEHYTDGSVDYAHIQDVAANSILVRDANSSGVLTAKALASGNILIGDGTGFTAASLSGQATMGSSGAVTIATLNQNTTGSAATLTTAREIGGVSFNGSAAIDLPGVNTAGNQATSGLAATATLAALSTEITISANNSTNETVYPTFVDGATGTQGVETDTGLTYNPSTGLLTATSFSGTVTGSSAYTRGPAFFMS